MRSFNRLPTDQAIQCVVSETSLDAHLYNLSCGGCMIELDHADLSKGDPIEVSFNNGTRVHGIVAWRVNRNAGVQFDHLLHTKTVEACGEWDANEPFDHLDMRDRYGLPLSEVHLGGPELIQPDAQSMCFTPARK